MASAGMSSEETGEPIEDEPVWHPAHEHLDETDTTTDPDYQPSPSEGERRFGVLDEWGGIESYEDPPYPDPPDDLEDLEDDDDDYLGAERFIRADPNDPTFARNYLFQLLASGGFREALLANGLDPGPPLEDDDLEEPDEDFILAMTARLAGRRRRPKFVWPKVPSEEGTKLMRSGHFGTEPYYVDRIKKRKEVFATSLMWRELGIDSHGVRIRADQSISQTMIPSSRADSIIHYDSRSYSGQFSDDGNFFFCCEQDFRVRMYDTSNPFAWKYLKTVEYPYGQWTITDASLSPDNRFLAYSSIRRTEFLPLPNQPITQGLDISRSRFGIWSLRFSGDGREVVAGTSENSVIVVDLETRTPVLTLKGRHQHHVNAVCFGDTSSPHILYSGSDDTTLRVWDRRSMADRREAGVFLGHTEGLTYIDSKGDGRYVLSNSKDQTMKLWDLRKMMPPSRADAVERNAYSTDFDYRFQEYPESHRVAHPYDHSVVTFRGHRVLKTLVRCHFSPPGSTNSRYVYTGSADGKVYVYNIDATLAGTIDVQAATMNSRPRGPDILTNMWDLHGDMEWRTCVRDASWHPNVPMIAATSWNGWGLSSGTCTIHSWNDGADEDEGDRSIGRCYDHKLRPLPEYNHYQDDSSPSPEHRRTRRTLRSRPVARLDTDEDDDDDW
ncbi:LEC14B protein [Penicillium cataractarum]|uniref:LEC14B protein n=1 Tax=Penicillium cataractarum TaxID=2100454 RepID=A0A9W9SG32_9EURO|nr:LEC14B protein [Penicillium cataractarum]KAJ5377477.1 LEC14B protein [Penicillium cataractarum]